MIPFGFQETRPKSIGKWKLAVCDREARDLRFPSKRQWDTSRGTFFTTTIRSVASSWNGAGQWVKGKSADTFAATGSFFWPRLIEIPNPGQLAMWLKVNGETRQVQVPPANMIFDVATLVSYVSDFMTLLPRVTSSQLEPSRGRARHETALYLKAGDVVELGS